MVETAQKLCVSPKGARWRNSTTPAYTGGYRPTPAFVTFKVIRVITYQLSQI